MNVFRSQARSVVTNPVEEVKEPMFAVVNLPATPETVVYEQPIGLPDVGGATGFGGRWVHLHAGNADVNLSVAHWRLNDGSLVQMVPDGTVVPALGRTAGLKAPDNAHSLVVDYNAPLGLSVVIEAK
jgi:hypothetical protein